MTEKGSNPSPDKPIRITKGSKVSVHNIIIPQNPDPNLDISFDLEERLTRSLRSLKKNKNLVLIDFFGEGGQGIVARMFDKILKTYVAVKISATNPLAAENEQACMKIIQDSDKEDLITIYENQSFKKCTFIKMECGVISVLDYLDFYEAKGMKISSNNGLFLCKSFLQLARSLKCLNMYNRDLKLENFIISESGVVKVVDFDLTQISENPVMKNVIPVGTDKYWHPELAKAKEEKRNLESFDLWEGELHTVYKTCQILLKNTEPSPEVKRLKRISSSNFKRIEEVLDEINIEQTKIEVPDEMIAYTIRYKINEGFNLNPLRIISILDGIGRKNECLMWIRETLEYMVTRNVEFQNYEMYFLDLAFLLLTEYKQRVEQVDQEYDHFNILLNYKRNFEEKGHLENFFQSHNISIDIKRTANPLYSPIDRVIVPEASDKIVMDLESTNRLVELCMACGKALHNETLIEDEDEDLLEAAIINQTDLIDQLAYEFYQLNDLEQAKSCLEISLGLKQRLYSYSNSRIKESYWALARCTRNHERGLEYVIMGYNTMEAKSSLDSSNFNEFMGDLHIKHKANEKAVKYYQNSIDLLLNSPLMPSDEIALIRCYLKLSACLKASNKHKLSISNCQEAMRLVARYKISSSVLEKYPDLLADYLEYLRVPAKFLNELASTEEQIKKSEKVSDDLAITREASDSSVRSLNSLPHDKIKTSISREDSIIEVF